MTPTGGSQGPPTGRTEPLARPQPPPQQPPQQPLPPPPQQTPPRAQQAASAAPRGGPGGLMGRTASIRYSVYGVGLLVVAVVAGLIWWAVHPANEPEPNHSAQHRSTTEQPAGKYQFAKAHGTVRGESCEDHSYGRIEQFFAEAPCDQLSRTIYWTRVKNVRVFTSVSVVTMPDASKAASLEHLTDSNGTGNVKDLLADGISVSGAPETVKGGGYASGRDGNVVTIVESKPEAGKKLPESVVTGVSRDALRLANQ